MNLRPGKSMLSILLAGLLTMTALAGCSDKQESSSSASSAAQTTTAATEAETTANADAETTAPETTEATETTTTHISPTETVSSTLGAELDDLNVLLDRDADNTYKAKLENFVQDGDVIQSFTFIFYAPDGVSNMGTYKGGCGISVKADSATATDKNWYQTGNIVTFTQDSSVSLTWIVPESIQDYIDPTGDLMLGYWWSDQATVTLNKVSVRYSNATGTVKKSDTKKKEEAQTAVKNEGAAAVSSEEVNQMSSSEIVADMKVGWNLGNTLDSYDTSSSDNETGWGNPKTTKAMIDTVKDAGFNAVRIPVTWGEHLSADNTIDADYLNRVQEIVDYAIDDNLYVILNVHHDDALWLHPTYSEQAAVTEKLTAIWKQLCERFGDYDHHLVFEGMNEPRVIGSATEWSGGTPEERDVINQLYQAFVDTVRATGGLNADRTLIISSHAQSITKEAVSAVKIPEDTHIAVSIHSYAPWDFCGTEDTRSDWGSDADKQELDTNFQYLEDTFISKGVPVLLDEFGAVNKNNTSIRAQYYAYYVKSAKAHGITCFVWDNGTESEFGLLNRKDLTWYAPSIIDAMMQALQA